MFDLIWHTFPVEEVHKELKNRKSSKPIMGSGVNSLDNKERDAKTESY